MAPENLNSEIYEKCKQREVKAFRCLVEHYQKYVYVLSFRMLNNEEEARDVVQECFMRIWKHIDKYNEKIKFSTWLYKICINLCCDHLKSLKRKNNYIKNTCEMNLATNNNDMENDFYRNELANQIKHIAESLPPKQKSIFILRDLQELEMKEIAEILNLDVNRIKSNLFYARRFIKEKLEESGYLKNSIN